MSCRERADLHPSADGGAKTIEGSARRLARMVGRDAATAPIDAWIRLASFFADRQLERLIEAATRVTARSDLSSHAPVVGAGVGGFLARKLAARLGRPYIEFATLTSRSGVEAEDVMACAPAFAVAHLLGESSAGSSAIEWWSHTLSATTSQCGSDPKSSPACLRDHAAPDRRAALSRGYGVPVRGHCR